MSEGYKYSVKNEDKGLTYIFLQKAKADGFQGSAKDVDWNKVMFTFESIQRQKKIKGDTDSLFSGDTRRNRANWHKNYVIHKGDEINVTDEQLKQIYDAMGFKPEKKAGTLDKPTEAPKVPTEEEKATIPATEPTVIEPKPAPATKAQIQERTEQLAAKEAGNNQDRLFNAVARGGSIKNLKSSDTIKKEAAAAAEAELNPPAKTSAPAVSTESNTQKPAEPAKKVLTAEEKQDNFTALVTGRRPIKKAEPKAPVEAQKPVAPAPAPVEAPKPVTAEKAPAPAPATSPTKVEVPTLVPTANPGSKQASINAAVKYWSSEPVAAEPQTVPAAAAATAAPVVAAKPSAVPEAAKPSIPTSYPEAPPAEASKSPTAPATSPDAPFTKLKTPSVNGQYQIIADDNKEGFRLATEVETIGQPEAKKFFQQRPLYTAKTNEWSIRGVLGEDAIDVQNKADRVSTGLSINTAIYSDLAAKQKAGTPLSEAETKFMQSHTAELQKHGLQLNDKNEIVETPKNGEIAETVAPKATDTKSDAVVTKSTSPATEPASEHKYGDIYLHSQDDKIYQTADGKAYVKFGPNRFYDIESGNIYKRISDTNMLPITSNPYEAQTYTTSEDRTKIAEWQKSDKEIPPAQISKIPSPTGPQKRPADAKFGSDILWSKDDKIYNSPNGLSFLKLGNDDYFNLSSNGFYHLQGGQMTPIYPGVTDEKFNKIDNWKKSID